MFFKYRKGKDVNDYEIVENDYGELLVLRIIDDNNRSLAVLKAVLDENKALLGDIDIPKKHVNQGLGSILLVRFEEICREKGITEINGNISNTDADHKERLLHFYSKHGYSIDYIDAEGFGGKIHKKLF